MFGSFWFSTTFIFRKKDVVFVKTSILLFCAGADFKELKDWFSDFMGLMGVKGLKNWYFRALILVLEGVNFGLCEKESEGFWSWGGNFLQLG